MVRDDSLQAALAWWVVIDLVPATVATLRRRGPALLRASERGTGRSGLRWEDTTAMAVVQSLVVATIIFGGIWVVVGFMILFGGGGGE